MEHVGKEDLSKVKTINGGSERTTHSNIAAKPPQLTNFKMPFIGLPYSPTRMAIKCLFITERRKLIWGTVCVKNK
jgi:hypothetical protein